MLCAALASIRKDCLAVPIKHPIDGETIYSVEEAAAWLTERGLPTAVGSLNSRRSNKQPPRSIRIGKRVWYRESALLEYLISKITEG
jgi:hypothetical protein